MALENGEFIATIQICSNGSLCAHGLVALSMWDTDNDYKELYMITVMYDEE